MFDSEVISLAISIVTLGVIVFLLFRGKTIGEAKATATEIATIVQSAVFAAEQLKATGQLPDNNAAFEYAYTQARKLLPTLERDTLEMWIESMVPLANQVINKDGVPPTPKPAPTVGRMGLE